MAALYQMRTIADVRQFRDALSEASRHCVYWGTLCRAAAEVIDEEAEANGEAAGAYGARTLAQAEAEFQRAIDILEPAAVRLINEPRRPGESPLTYMQRIDGLVGPDGAALAESMKRRGLMLMPW